MNLLLLFSPFMATRVLATSCISRSVDKQRKWFYNLTIHDSCGENGEQSHEY